MPTPEFTREDILRTLTDTHYIHPVIDVWREYHDYMRRISERSEQISDGQKSHQFLKLCSHPWMEALEKAGSFNLGSIDLVAIWTNVVTLPRYRYLMAEALSSTWSIQDINNPPYWEGFPWEYMRGTDGIPRRFINDKQGLMYIKDRLILLDVNVKQLDHVTHGTRRNSREQLNNLGEGLKAGEPSAGQKYRLMNERLSKTKIPIVDNLSEAFGNELGGLLYDVGDEI